MTAVAMACFTAPTMQVNTTSTSKTKHALKPALVCVANCLLVPASISRANNQRIELAWIFEDRQSECERVHYLRRAPARSILSRLPLRPLPLAPEPLPHGGRPLAALALCQQNTVQMRQGQALRMLLYACTENPLHTSRWLRVLAHPQQTPYTSHQPQKPRSTSS